MQTKDFLELLFGDHEGFVFISTKDEDGHLNQHKAFQYPDNLPQLEKYVSVRTDEDVYFSPMLFKVPRRTKPSVSYTPVVWADTDTFDPSGFLIPPSINIVSSQTPEATRRASLWILDDDYPKEEVEAVTKAIAMAHAYKIDGKQGGVDPSGYDLTQLLRFPGSVNNKYLIEEFKEEYKEPYPVYIEDGASCAVYSLEEFQEAYDPSNLPQVREDLEDEIPADLPDIRDVLRKVTASNTLAELYSTAPRGNQDWSDTMYLFLSECFRNGFTPEEALVAGWQAQCNKYKRDNRPMEHLWKYDVKRAYADPENRPGTRINRTAAPVEHRPKDEGLSKELDKVLLTDEERAQLTRTFIDEYCDWAEMRTDAPRAYHVAGALTVLSLVFGEWGYAYPQFGKVFLALFFVVMGETTDTRKSTSRNLMTDFVEGLENSDFDYRLTSDATSEALLDALADRANQSSLYDRDEVQDLIADVKGGKGYMKGFLVTLNEFYDGKARGRMRKGIKNKEVKVNFVQYMMGIRTQIQENLEMRDFANGWGPRNIYVRGESPPRTREKDRLKQGVIGSDSDIDPLKTKLTMRMMQARNFWVAECKADRANKQLIPFEEDAWIKQTDLEWDLMEYFEGHPRYDIIKACVQRLSINVMKVAVLFAMYDMRKTVSMVDVLNARYYAAQWVEDLIIMIEGVNASVEQRVLDKIENYIIQHDGLVSYAQILKWATGEGIKKRDFIEYIQTLTETEVIVDGLDNAGKRALELAL